MLSYSWFAFVALAGTAGGLLLGLISKPLRQIAWSSRLGCAFGGASVGAFASGLLLLAFPDIPPVISDFALAPSIAVAFGFGVQKCANEGRFPLFLGE